MTEINKLSCGSNAKNTGVSDCPFDLGFIRKHIKVTKDFEMTPTDVAALQVTLEALLLAPRATRIFPFPNWEQITDNSEDVSLQTYGYGSKSFGRQGDNDWSFDFLDGALCASKNMKTHNGKGYYLLVDSNLRIIGTKVGDNIKGIPMQMQMLKPKAADGTNATKYASRFIFDANYIWDDIAFIDKVSGFNPLLLEGLQDVILRVGPTPGTTSAVKLTATTGCDKADMGVLFPTEMLVAANWKGAALAGGATVTPTGVAYAPGVDTAGVFTVTFAAAVASVSLVDPVALDTAGISGFESNVLAPVV